MGDPGSGKSALVCNWIKQNESRQDVVIVSHFVGCTSASTGMFIYIINVKSNSYKHVEIL